MSVKETNEISDDIARYLDWALETGLWDGRLVSWMEASEFRDEIQARIFQRLFEHPELPSFDRLAAKLAWIGASHNARSLLARDIEALDFSKSDFLLQVGSKNHISKFWKKHKTAVMIGIAIVAAITIVTVVAISTAGVGTGAVASALGGAAGQLSLANPEEEKKRLPIPKQVEASPPSDPPPPSKSALVFEETGIVLNGQSISYQDILVNPMESDLSVDVIELPLPAQEIQISEPPCFPALPSSSDINPSANRSWIAKFFDTMGRSMIEPELFDPNVSLPMPEFSHIFSTPGESKPWLCIEGINGMNTTKQEALAHAEHLAKFAQGHSIDWVYNHSHGAVVDVLEILTLNLPGTSPNTSGLLLEAWTAFHARNPNRPNVKLLQFCHSQSTIHVRNALEKAPREIRDRVIVQAFGPAVIIPEGLCYESRHYACKGDVVPYLEMVYFGGFPEAIELAKQHREQLIWVEQHPDTRNPHDFQNPAFNRTKIEIIDDHIKRKGEYK